mmetsp:Transcript_2035/g.2948  ORF Transcript_2035/g.2948 Transcript_2035/m.2948 type:complete len:119 (-) Transcript_2035:19-375(-)
MFHVLLNRRIRKPSSNQTFCIEHSIRGIHGNLVFSRISNETFCFSERNIRRSGSVSLIIRDDFNAIVLPHSDARISSSEINTDAFPFDSCHSSQSNEFNKNLFFRCCDFWIGRYRFVR